MVKFINTTGLYFIIFVIVMAAVLLPSCSNRTSNIPFPSAQLDNQQPVTEPLQFTGERKLNWTTVRTGGINPVIKHFDLNAIPAVSYEKAQEFPFQQQPVEKHFSWDTLPDEKIDFNTLLSKSLYFKTSVLPQPEIIKAGKFVQKNSPYPVHDFTAAQGMHGRIVTAFLKDHNGFMWTATDAGLYRFDGTFLYRYYVIDNNQLIEGLGEDPTGRIWMLRQGRLLVIDIAASIISQSAALPFRTGNLNNLFFDSRGLLWLGNPTDSVLRVVNPQNGTYKQFPKTLCAGYMVTEDKRHNMWIPGPGRLQVFNFSTGDIKILNAKSGLVFGMPKCMTVDSKGTVWCTIDSLGLQSIDPPTGTINFFGPKQGILKATGSNGGIRIALFCDRYDRLWFEGENFEPSVLDPKRRLVLSFPTGAGFTNNTIIALGSDASQKIWLGLFVGVSIIENTDMSLLLDKENVSATMEDVNGNIWAGTDVGLRVLDPNRKLIRNVTVNDGISDNQIQSISAFDNEIWLTTNKGLDIYNPNNKTIQHLGAKEGMSGDTIFDAVKDNFGNICFTTPSSGIDLIDANKTTIRHAGTDEGLNDANILDMRIDKQGKIWLSSQRRGADIIDLSKGTVKYLTNKPGLTGSFNRVLGTDSLGRIWIGTQAGVYMADEKNNTLTYFTRKNGLTGDRVNCLLPTQNGMLVCTEGKPCLVTQKNGKWLVQPVRDAEGIVKAQPNTFNSHLVSSTGQLYWGDVGLGVYPYTDADTNTAVTYITGFQLMGYPQYFACKSIPKNIDTVWASDSFYTKGNLPKRSQFQNPENLEWDSVAGPYNLPVKLVLPYNANYLQFTFGQAGTGRPDSVMYAYILQGVDNQWNVTAETISENYLNLPPGNYTFQVCSKGLNGVWGQPTSFSFKITPPWWKTWWAYTILILLVFGTITAYVRYRSAKLLREKSLLEQKVKQRTEALQKSIEELKSTQAQLVQSEKMASLGELTAGIAHEIQNPLNFVNNFAEVSIELAEELKETLATLQLTQAQADDIKDLTNSLINNQQKINFHGKRADAIVKSMLQHSRSSPGQKEPADINTIADKYLRLSYHGLRAKEKSFNAKLETNFDTMLPKITILGQEVGRVLLNLFTNAFYSVMQKKKQLGAGYEPTVSVTTRRAGNMVEIKVHDNGLGIPQHVIDKIYNPFFTTKPTGEGTGLGLSLSYDIITKVHGGTIKVDTKENEFAEFTIQLPL